MVTFVHDEVRDETTPFLVLEPEVALFIVQRDQLPHLPRRVESSRVESSRVESRQVESSRVASSRVESSRVASRGRGASWLREEGERRAIKGRA